jgi:hypothetical protein
MTSLTHILKEMAQVGPNDWDGVTQDDFGFSFDYIIEGHGSITIIDPTSRAALQWLYAHLPEDCPRWGKLGFAIETNYVSDVLEGMARDGLKSEAEYVEAMNGEQELQNAQAHDADFYGCTDEDHPPEPGEYVGWDYPEIY